MARGISKRTLATLVCLAITILLMIYMYAHVCNVTVLLCSQILDWDWDKLREQQWILWQCELLEYFIADTFITYTRTYSHIQAVDLNEEMLALRQVDYVDIAFDQLSSGEYDEKQVIFSAADPLHMGSYCVSTCNYSLGNVQLLAWRHAITDTRLTAVRLIAHHTIN